jgi:crooked neck
VGTEEYYDYLFPEEAGAAPNLKLLEAAYRWKKARTEGGADGGGGGGANGGGGASAGAAPGTAGPGGE